MIDLEYFRVVYKNIRNQRLRSFLTLLGIIIGIASIVALISLGDGLQQSVNEQFESLGTDKITVIGGTGISFGPPAPVEELTKDDVKTVQRVEGVDAVGVTLLKNAEIEFAGETLPGSIAAIDVKGNKKLIEDMSNYEAEKGRLLESNDRFKVVIGHNAAKDMFEKEIEVRDKIIIDGKGFRVVGILKKIGNQKDDMSLIIPLDTARTVFDEPEKITAMIISIDEGFIPSEVADRIEEELEDARGAKDFSVATVEEIQEKASSIIGVIQAIFVGIAAISLVVGGIGIMNTMLMAVMERTREIGIMKATGATNRKILTIFLLESGMVGLIGGLIGAIIGYLLAFAMGTATTGFAGIDLKIYFSPTLFVSVLAFSMIVGIFSGVYPSRNAARMDPVEALRYE